MDQVQVQFELVREMASEPSPTVRLFALSYSSTLGDKALWKQKAEFKTAASPKLLARTTTVTLPVEFRSQVVPNAQWIGRICAPASLAMAATAFGVNHPTQQFAAEIYDPVSDLFGVWHRMVQGGAQHGLRGYITRFRSWEQVRRAVESGQVICA
ncbi:MAG: C39 family peptidase, partial [Candidatus Sumerlaeaceae bacterium]